MSAKWAAASLAILGAVALAVPASASPDHHRHHFWHYGHASYHHRDHHGGWGLDVAPGGGHYTARSVAMASPLRMSHPFVGEPRAPSAVARGPASRVNNVERRMTRRLNLEQLYGP
ncbi:MAG: hypothetical protein ACREFD_16570 [Stellaceae bacterium]